MMKEQDQIKIVANWMPPNYETTLESIKGVKLVEVSNREELLKEIADAEVACISGQWDAELLAAAPHLRWVHVFSGGVENYLFPEFIKSPVVFTCLKGFFAVPAAEHALALMLLFTRCIHYDLRRQKNGDYGEYRGSEQSELTGKTIGIIGLGNIGREVAKKVHCLGMHVVGLDRQTNIDDPSFEQLFQPGQMAELLEMSDLVTVAVPLTKDTCGLIGAAELKAMKPTAYLIDVSGRNDLYDLDALAKALRENEIAGAGMQLSPAPPPDSPLWETEKFIYFYHRACSRELDDQLANQFCENLRRYLRGEALLGQVNKELGY